MIKEGVAKFGLKLGSALPPILPRGSLVGYSKFFTASQRWGGNLATPDLTRLQKLQQELERTKKEFKDKGKKLPNDTDVVFEISERSKRFLEEVESYGLNRKYSRGGAEGEGYVGIEEIIKLGKDHFYDKASSETLSRISSKVQNRMRSKVSKDYIDHALNIPKTAKNPNPILKVVMPDAREVDDLSGEGDPSNQNLYSPLPGLLQRIWTLSRWSFSPGRWRLR